MIHFKLQSSNFSCHFRDREKIINNPFVPKSSKFVINSFKDFLWCPHVFGKVFQILHWPRSGCSFPFTSLRIGVDLERWWRNNTNTPLLRACRSILQKWYHILMFGILLLNKASLILPFMLCSLMFVNMSINKQYKCLRPVVVQRLCHFCWVWLHMVNLVNSKFNMKTSLTSENVVSAGTVGRVRYSCLFQAGYLNLLLRE